jgi:hypothetical protein
LGISASAESITGIGYLSGLVFNENGKPVDGKNPTLGPSVSELFDGPGDGKPSFSGFEFTGAPFIKSCGAENPLAGLVNDEIVKYLWCELGKKDFSSVVFFTSDLPPEYCPGNVSGKSHSSCCCCWSCRKCRSDGDIPCPTPEPTSLVLLLTGVVAGGVGHLRALRRRSE